MKFKDGQKIDYSWVCDYFWNVFMGTMSHQYTGKPEYRDEENKLYAYFEFGAYKMRT